MRSTWIVALLALVGPGLAPAQNNPWTRQVADQLRRAETALEQRGYRRSASTRTGTLNGEERATLPVRLQTGVTYAIVGVCDEDCASLSLVLATASGNEVAIDRTSGSVPVIEFTPRETADYEVKVVMAACRMNPCWYGVAVYGP